MKTFYLATTAALLLASTAAQAGSNGNAVSFQIEGQQVRIALPKNCESLNCIQISAPGLAKSGLNLKGLNTGKSDDDVAEAPPAANTTPTAAPTPPAPPAAPPTQAAAPAAQSEASNTPAPILHDVIVSAPPAPPAAATVPAAQTAATPPVTAPVAAANTPVGVWQTEDDKGNIRIEACGANLCGYSVNSGEKILINMHPEESKWVGRIHDPSSGRNYDSNIAMRGTNTLRVQGCALGGLFCGGQTWKRVS